MKGIFVSYRRQDSQSAAGRLSDHLRDHLAGVPIFRDVETIEPGVDFVEAIERALASCGVLVAVIGPRWLSVTDAEGQRRLDSPDDYTRIEIATALNRTGVRVIPVLVEGAVMPLSTELPDDLGLLARRNAIELTDRRWDYDVSQLVDTLRKVLELTPDPESDPVPPPPPPPPAKGGWVKWTVIGVIGLGLIGLFAEEQGGVPTPPDVTYTVPAEVAPPPSPVVPDTRRRQTAVDLTGFWRDEDGGELQVAQQGSVFQVRGMTSDGVVEGHGTVSGLRGQTVYWLNGVELHASFTISSDGNRIDATVVDPRSGARESSMLVRRH
ncbi:MAG TPA: toll/interleukin-1 receptor domain-containing protein [Denitromonas sp.]|uniref:toll/interleukin-1 receptor domain-containing protein n=1 Tax=Denitromonas sp. TaxID=2734609 RepID=UPI001DB8E8D3|nr:toll/interleukin-1 receptor domain-containing protein [Rhodocyclaceae bacterium]MCP5223175.1 toll/interleukin-1 receptor domain-containing protein [Zoogloeaceae bacterium]HQV14508.1 toll/interleukin-1 receptor domain-containing protein [Denitromonas sp.]